MKFPKVLLKPIRNFCFIQNFNILLCTLVLPRFKSFQNHFLCMQLLPPLKSKSQNYFTLECQFNPFLPHTNLHCKLANKRKQLSGYIELPLFINNSHSFQQNKTNKQNVECNWRQNWVTNLIRNHIIFITTWTNMGGTILFKIFFVSCQGDYIPMTFSPNPQNQTLKIEHFIVT